MTNTAIIPLQPWSSVLPCAATSTVTAVMPATITSLELSLDEVDSVLLQMKEMGVYFAVISGGEPFYMEGIFEIFKNIATWLFWSLPTAG